MIRLGSLRKALWIAGIALLSVLVCTLSVEAKARANATQQHLAKHYKATDASESRPAFLAAAVHASPAALDPPPVLIDVFFTPAETVPGRLDRAFSAHPLRGPPAPIPAAC